MMIKFCWPKYPTNPIIIPTKVHGIERHNTKWEKIHNGRSEFLSPKLQYFNSLCSLLRGNKNVFKWIFTEHRWPEKEAFLKEEVIVAMLKIICYQCRLIVASRLEFSASIRRSSHCYRNDQIERHRVRLKKGKFAIWYMECWSTIVLWFLWKSSIRSSQISFCVRRKQENRHPRKRTGENSSNKKCVYFLII